MNLKNLIKTFLLLALTLTSCSKDDCNLQENGANLELPALKKGSFPEGQVDIELGSSFVFAPQVINSDNVYYQWYINDEDKGTARELEVKADKPMRSKLLLELTNDNGQVVLERNVVVPGADYSGKYLIINEGWYGHGNGNITVLDPADNTVEQSSFTNQNFGTTLGVTSQSATLWNGKLYVCSKNNQQLTIIDPKTLYLEKQTEALLGSRQAYEFVGINEQYGIITANGDLYRVDLNTLKAEQILMSDGYFGTGSAVVYQNKLLVNVRNKMIHVLDLDLVLGDLTQYSYKNYFPFTTIDVSTTGGCRFVNAKDGNLYTIESTSDGVHNLVKIKPNFAIEKVAIRSDYSPSSFAAYSEASFCSSADGDVFYYIAGGNIYKSSFDNPAPENPFTSYSKNGYSFYGAGIRVNPYNNELIATYLTSDYSSNLVVRFNGNTGEQIAEVTYGGYYFPATIIFVK